MPRFGSLERLGLRYGVAIRGELTWWTAGARRADTATVIADASLAEAWQAITWGTGTAGPLTAAFCAVRVLGLLYVIHNRRLLGTLDSFRRNPPLRR